MNELFNTAKLAVLFAILKTREGPFWQLSWIVGLRLIVKNDKWDMDYFVKLLILLLK